MPCKTRIAARTAKELTKPVMPMLNAAARATTVRPSFLFVVSVILPTRRPKAAYGMVYARPVRVPKFFFNCGYAVESSNAGLPAYSPMPV